MDGNKEDIVYRCKDCIKYNLCSYYYRRKETSQICHYFELTEHKTKRKTGKWIEVRQDHTYVNGYLTEYYIACSACGARAFVDTKKGLEKTAYCPFCGAEMEVDA